MSEYTIKKSGRKSTCGNGSAISVLFDRITVDSLNCLSRSEGDHRWILSIVDYYIHYLIIHCFYSKCFIGNVNWSRDSWLDGRVI